MSNKIVKYLPNQVELKITWNSECSEHSSNWMVFLDGTYDFLGDNCGGVIPEPTKEQIAYAIGEINSTELFKLIVQPAMEHSIQVIEFLFKTEAELQYTSNALADMLLFLQDDISVMPDYSNSFTQFMLVDGEWSWVDFEW